MLPGTNLSRRGGRGGHGGYLDSKPRSFYKLPPDRDPDIAVEMKQPALQVWKAPRANPANWNGVQPRELTPVASYNWTSERRPTIIVPGCPPIWQNKPTPFKVPRDSGRSFADQNRFRMPLYPLLPAFVAIEHMQPTFDYAALDVVTDRNNLRKLLRWIENTCDKDFRIDLQLCGPKTVVLGRWESKPVEMNPERLGFGLNFERYMTRPLVGCEKSTGHHRIITYDYGGLKMLVRFEVDACIMNDSETQATSVDNSLSQLSQSPGPDDDDLAAAMGGLSLRTPAEKERDGVDDLELGPEICVIPAGQFVPQSSLAELSTKSLKYMDPNHSRGGGRAGSSRRTAEPEPDWGLYFPQLFISGTPHHKFAVHERGQFRRVYERKLRDDMLRQHLKTQQHAFDKLRVVLGRIIELVKEKGKDARLSLVYQLDEGKMELCERKSDKSCLPKAWMQKFEPLPTSEDDERTDFHLLEDENEVGQDITQPPDANLTTVDKRQNLKVIDDEETLKSTSNEVGS